MVLLHNTRSVTYFIRQKCYRWVQLTQLNDANSENADLMVFSELFLSGYPPEDLVLRHSFLDEIDMYLKLLVEETKI